MWCFLPAVNICNRCLLNPRNKIFPLKACSSPAHRQKYLQQMFSTSSIEKWPRGAWGQVQVKRWLASLTLHRTTLIMPLVLLLPLPMRWDTTLAWITILLAAVLPVRRMEAASWLLQLGESGLLGLTGKCRGLRGGRTRNAEWGGSAWCSSLL